MQHFPAAGEIVFFDRSWYNRAGVERVLGFCTPQEVDQFLRSCPDLSACSWTRGSCPMDMEARNHWVEFSEAKDEMFAHTYIPEAPWFTVEADDKRRARLNTIRHLLAKVPYEDVTPPAIDPLDRSAAPPQRQTRAEAASERAVPRAERSPSPGRAELGM